MSCQFLLFQLLCAFLLLLSFCVYFDVHSRPRSQLLLLQIEEKPLV